MAPVPLAWTERNVELLEQAGATEVGVFRTGPWLLGLTAREFFDRVIVGQFAARGMVEGPNFGFGRDRGGDSRLLAEWCAEAGLAFEVAAPTEVDGQIVSSTRIRRALAEGRVDEAERPARPAAPDPRDRDPRRRQGRRPRLPDGQPRRDRHPDPRRRRLRRPRLRRRPGPAVPGRRPHRPERHLRRAGPQGRGPPDRLLGRPLRPDGRARFPRAAPPVAASSTASTTCSARSAPTWIALKPSPPGADHDDEVGSRHPLRGSGVRIVPHGPGKVIASPRPRRIARPVRRSVTRPIPGPAGARRAVAIATLSVVAAGVLFRVARYASNWPLWGDEAFVAVSLITRGFAGLARPLDYFQITPVGFLWAERAVVASPRSGGVGPAARAVPGGAGVALAVLAVRRGDARPSRRDDGRWRCSRPRSTRSATRPRSSPTRPTSCSPWP